MAESVFSTNEQLVSSFTQIPSMEQTGKEPIQAQSQSQFQSNSSRSPTGKLKRDRASAYATPSVDEKGREILVCDYFQSVIPVGGEKETSDVKVEIPLRNVKSRTRSDGKKDPFRLLLDPTYEDQFNIEGVILLRTARQALKDLLKAREERIQRNSKAS